MKTEMQLMLVYDKQPAAPPPPPLCWGAGPPPPPPPPPSSSSPSFIPDLFPPARHGEQLYSNLVQAEQTALGSQPAEKHETNGNCHPLPFLAARSTHSPPVGRQDEGGRKK